LPFTSSLLAAAIFITLIFAIIASHAYCSQHAACRHCRHSAAIFIAAVTPLLSPLAATLLPSILRHDHQHYATPFRRHLPSPSLVFDYFAIAAPPSVFFADCRLFLSLSLLLPPIFRWPAIDYIAIDAAY